MRILFGWIRYPLPLPWGPAPSLGWAALFVPMPR
jgi:hypothetical protein